MRNKLEKIKYNKCPACKKYGLSAFSKISHGHNPVVKCKHCGKQYSVNVALSIVLKISIAAFWGVMALIFEKYLTPLSIWFWGIIAIISYFVFEYFAPFEECDK